MTDDISRYVDPRTINRMRNPHKRAYALAYLAWLRSGETDDPPARPAQLGIYAAGTVSLLMSTAWHQRRSEG
jgi:hypothetical protein